MQDAKAHLQPPSLFFGIKPKRKTLVYTPLDVVLADALRLYDDSLCSGCHLPARWVWDPPNARYFELDPDAPQCVVCELLEAPPEQENDKLEPGEKRRVLNTMFDGGGDG